MHRLSSKIPVTKGGQKIKLGCFLLKILFLTYFDTKKPNKYPRNINKLISQLKTPTTYSKNTKSNQKKQNSLSSSFYFFKQGKGQNPPILNSSRRMEPFDSKLCLFGFQMTSGNFLSLLLFSSKFPSFLSNSRTKK